MLSKANGSSVRVLATSCILLASRMSRTVDLHQASFQVFPDAGRGMMVSHAGASMQNILYGQKATRTWLLTVEPCMTVT
jgi:hypothetical protein